MLKPNYFDILTHRISTIVSWEIYPLYSVIWLAEWVLLGLFFSFFVTPIVLCPFRAFDERLDFHGTPELDDSKEFKNEEAEKKELLPLETFKKQLNRLYLLTEGLPKNPDSCKSRSVPVKQARSSFSFSAAINRWDALLFPVGKIPFWNARERNWKGSFGMASQCLLCPVRDNWEWQQPIGNRFGRDIVMSQVWELSQYISLKN